VGNTDDLARLLVAIAVGDRSVVTASHDAAPVLATASLARGDEFFIAECHAQGFHHYLFNSAGDLAADAADAAGRAAAHDLESLVRQAVARLDVADPTDRSARQDALDDVEPEDFEDLDEAFYALKVSADLDEVMRDLLR
jgi:hypothetical protein